MSKLGYAEFDEELIKLGLSREGGTDAFVVKGKRSHACLEVDASDMVCVYISVSNRIASDWLDDVSLVLIRDYTMDTIYLIHTVFKMFKEDEQHAVAFINSIA